ncbi:MAG: c-type cytochrome [Rugosibacter sp.]
MKNPIAVVVVTAIAFVSGTAFADAGLELAKEKQCLSCHAVDKTLFAPSFRDIAKKYKKASAGMEGALITQIISGTATSGGYHWGTMKMPPSNGPRPAVSIIEANELLDWILSQK